MYVVMSGKWPPPLTLIVHIFLFRFYSRIWLFFMFWLFLILHLFTFFRLIVTRALFVVARSVCWRRWFTGLPSLSIHGATWTTAWPFPRSLSGSVSRPGSWSGAVPGSFPWFWSISWRRFATRSAAGSFARRSWSTSRSPGAAAAVGPWSWSTTRRTWPTTAPATSTAATTSQTKTHTQPKWVQIHALPSVTGRVLYWKTNNIHLRPQICKPLLKKFCDHSILFHLIYESLSPCHRGSWIPPHYTHKRFAQSGNYSLAFSPLANTLFVCISISDFCYRTQEILQILQTIIEKSFTRDIKQTVISRKCNTVIKK